MAERQATGRRSLGQRRRQRAHPKPVFGFLDETGTLASARDPFFAVGLLRCPEPYLLQRPIQRFRDQHHFYDEIKWSQASPKKAPVLRTILDVFIGADATFSAFVAEKARHDVISRFGGQFEAYECLARQLVKGSIRRGESLWIVADEYSSPHSVTFEENVRDHVNRNSSGQPVAGVLRMRSIGVDLLQVADLLLGAVVYDYKLAAGLGSYNVKIDLLDHLKHRAGVPTFIGGFRDSRFNVAEYGL